MPDDQLIHFDDRSITQADRPAWLAQRHLSLGSSDAAVVCGVIGSRLKLWLEKTQRLPDSESNEAMRWGLRLEDDIADAWLERTGIPIVRFQVFCRHPEYPWMTATIDGLTADDDIVEFKAAGHFGHGAKLGDDGEIESLPEHWILQSHHQMLVTSNARMSFAVFGPGLRLRTFELPFDVELGAMIVEQERAFWHDHVLAGIPPVEIVSGDAAYLAQAYDEPDGSWAWLGQDVLESAVNFERIGKQIRELEKEREAHKARLLLALGDSSGAELPDGWSLERKIIDVKEFTVAARKQVRLFVKPPKESTE